jgi:P pilus assembly chaperone PapD
MLHSIHQFSTISKLVLGLSLSSFITFSSSAIAQVKVSPLIIEAKANRGQAQDIISITNNSNQPSRVRIYAEPFTYSRNSGFQTLPVKTPNDLTPYLQFSPRELTIQPGKTRKIRVISRLAPNLPDGEYRAVVFNESLNEANSGEKNVEIATVIGVTFYVTKGNVNPRLAVNSASFDQQKSKIQLLVSNQGKASAVTDVNWILRRGETVVAKGLIDDAALIAEGERNLGLTFADESKPNLTPGIYQLSGELLWGENGRNKQSFNVNLTIPTEAARKK